MSKDKVSRYSDLQDKFDQLSQREKWSVWVTGIVLILALGFVFYIEPMLNGISSHKEQVRRYSQELVSWQRQVGQLTEDIQQSPNTTLTARVNETDQLITQLDDQLMLQTRDLVPPEQMAQVLESMLLKTRGVELLSLESIAPTRMLESNDESKEVGLFRHGVRLSVTGRYFDIQQYLGGLEALPWRLYWKKFDYRVTDYPQATLELEVYSLSTSKAFMGVDKHG